MLFFQLKNLTGLNQKRWCETFLRHMKPNHNVMSWGWCVFWEGGLLLSFQLYGMAEGISLLILRTQKYLICWKSSVYFSSPSVWVAFFCFTQIIFFLLYRSTRTDSIWLWSRKPNKVVYIQHMSVVIFITCVENKSFILYLKKKSYFSLVLVFSQMQVEQWNHAA